jgi:hypothetical protein
MMFIGQPINTNTATLERLRCDDVNAWVCRGVECLPATDSLNALRDILIKSFQQLSNYGYDCKLQFSIQTKSEMTKEKA